MSNIRTQLNKVVGKSLNAYYQKTKPTIDELKFKEEYQGRIIDCMVGEVDDNYIETPETDAPVVKLEHSREGVVKIPSIKGKTILVDADGNETDTPAEGCRLVSVGEEEDNKLIILSNKGANIWDGKIINENETDFIRILGNDVTITMPLYRKEEGACYIRVDFFDKNKNKTRQFLMGDNYKRQSYSLTQDEFYIKVIGVKKEVPLEVTLENLPFLLHTSPNLVPIGNAKHHKTEILLNKPLNGIKNISSNFYDYIKDDKIVRNTLRVVFDGSEDWGMADSSLNRYDDEVVLDFVADIYEKTKNMKIHSQGMADNGFTYTTSVIHKKGKQIGINANGRVYVRIPKSELKDSSSGANVRKSVKEFFKENNVTVIVFAKEPIIEELPNGITLQGFDDTTMYIENSTTPTVTYGYNALIPYKEELSQQKEEVEINTLDIENNIIPYLMDMEFNLMLMEDNE